MKAQICNWFLLALCYCQANKRIPEYGIAGIHLEIISISQDSGYDIHYRNVSAIYDLYAAFYNMNTNDNTEINKLAEQSLKQRTKLKTHRVRSVFQFICKVQSLLKECVSSL